MTAGERRSRGLAGGAAAGPRRRWGARVRRPVRVAGGRQPGVAGLAGGAQRRRGAPTARRRGLRCSETDAERPPGRDLRERPPRLRRPLAALRAVATVASGSSRRGPGGSRGARSSPPTRSPSPAGRRLSTGSSRRRTAATPPSVSPGAATSSASCACSTWSARKLLPVAVPECWNTRVAWLPDSSGFFFPAGPYVMNQPRDLLFLAVGDGEPRRESIAALGITQASNPEPLGGYPAGLGGWALAHAQQLRAAGDASSSRAACRTASGSRSSRTRWTSGPMASWTATTTSRWSATMLRVAVSCDLPLESAHDRSTWVELLPESDEVLVSVDDVAGHYVVCSLMDAAARVRILDRDGRLVDEVPLPERGVVAEHAFSGNYKIFPPIEGGSVIACGESFTFTFASPGRSPATLSLPRSVAAAHAAPAARVRPRRRVRRGPEGRRRGRP